MAYGYIDAALGTPDYHTQHFSILSHVAAYGLGPVHICHEVIPENAKDNKPILCGMLDNLHRGDTMVVTDFLKLGGSTAEVLDVLSTLSRRGIKIYVCSGYRLDCNADALVVNMACSLIRMIEKELQIRPEPDKAPIQMQRADADHQTPARRTRKSKLDGRRSEIEELLSTGVSMSSAAQRLGVSRPTLSDWLESRNLSVQNPSTTT